MSEPEQESWSGLLGVVAASLGLTVAASAVGGHFGAAAGGGAAFVLDRHGDRLVLKVVEGGYYHGPWSTGAALANHLRSTGYPAPQYVGVGVVEAATWSLQTVLPGEIPPTTRVEHVRQLANLAAAHAG